MRSFTSLLASSAFLFLSGCRNSDDVLHPVAGQVLVDGKPLTKGDIAFVPDHAKGNTHLPFGMGKIGPDGRYVLKTYQQDGLKSGWYKVMILATENEPQENPSWVPIWLVPVRLTKPETTDLSVEVKADMPAGAADFDIRR